MKNVDRTRPIEGFADYSGDAEEEETDEEKYNYAERKKKIARFFDVEFPHTEKPSA